MHTADEQWMVGWFLLIGGQSVGLRIEEGLDVVYSTSWWRFNLI